jgi:NAD(P)-dependent dehydrogenase (short-subunit alcohol dehydrogenase family)
VDLDADRPSVLADRLVNEILSGRDFADVGYRGSRRVRQRPVPDRIDEPGPAGLAIDPEDVLLVTGGARGITAAIAIDVARRYHPMILVVGRTAAGPGDEPPHVAGVGSERELKTALLADARRTGQPISAAAIEKAYTTIVRRREVRANLDAMRQAGARVEYRQVDVVDDRAFGRVIEDVYRTYGRLDGVIHGAGVIEDALVEHKRADSFARVFETKVRSALTLIRHVRPESLRLFVLFASVAGRFGNRGQIDYAAANESLNKLALHLDRRWPGRIVSLNWGPWAADGMASGAIRQQFIDRGITPIEVAAGCRAFDRELRYGRKGQVEVVLGQGHWDSVPSPADSESFHRIERSTV